MIWYDLASKNISITKHREDDNPNFLLYPLSDLCLAVDSNTTKHDNTIATRQNTKRFLSD